MPKILIVHDNRIILNLLLKELTQDNLKVVTLDTMELFWEYIRTNRPDLVLLGLHAESFDSWQVLDEIKRKIPNLPVLIYSIKSDHSISSLKEAINEVLKNRNISSAFMFHAYRKPKYDQIE